MKFQQIMAIVLIFASISLSSCISTYSRYGYLDVKAVQDKFIGELCNALHNQDAESVKNLFSDTTVEHVKNLDEQIAKALPLFASEITDVEIHYGIEIGETRDGEKTTFAESVSARIKDDATVTDICRRVNDEYENHSTFFENMLTFLIDQLLIHLYRNYGNNNSEKPSAQLIGKHRIAFLAIQYIYENCQNNLSTKDVSAYINVSTSYLCRCFKEATGISVLDFYERIRCRRAREDLSLGTYSVTQVAEKYNFNSLSYFNRRYKKYCGTAPMTTLTEAKKKRAAMKR